MTEIVVSWFSGLNQELAIFLMSMIPIVELRGAIILAYAWGIDWLRALPVCVIGNMLPIPFIILFMRSILNFLKKTKSFSKIAEKLHARTMEKADKVLKYEVWGLFLFVAIPLPGTGAWTGALIASLLDIRLKKAFPAILLGVLAAGIIMTLASYGVFDMILDLIMSLFA